MSDASGDVLTQRELNRATLARQMLLDRAQLGPAEAIEHLVGMQAQAPRAPFVGLWSRLADFRHEELSALVTSRHAVRAALQRRTLHLVSARDCLAMRPLLQPLLESGYRSSPFARRIAGADIEAVRRAGQTLLDERPLTRVELGRALIRQWPDADEEALAYTISYLVPLVQVPPRGTWTGAGAARWTTVRAWLGADASQPMSADELLLRYLGAFGPATVMDAQAWCGLSRLGEVAERLGGRLRRFRDPDGRELLDLPEAPRPDPDTSAPPRFLPEYDNLLLSHADRSRVVPNGQMVPLYPGHGGTRGELLVDGMWAANWAITRADGTATLTVETFGRLRQRTAVIVEGFALLAFVAPGAAHDVQVAPAP